MTWRPCHGLYLFKVDMFKSMALYRGNFCFGSHRCLEDTAKSKKVGKCCRETVTLPKKDHTQDLRNVS